MKQHMRTLTHLLSQNDEHSLQQHYLDSSDAENVVQLAHLFQQGMSEISSFDFYQQLATKLIASKSLPVALVAQIKTNDTLSFFTPALQLQDNFKVTNHLQRNPLHYLLAGNQATASHPPFNYLRSMMLFGSNETLRDALCQRDSQNLTAIEVYLFSNQNLATLPAHELTALLALIEIESKQQAVVPANYIQRVEAVNQLCRSQNKAVSNELQRLIIIAVYFTKSIDVIVNELKQV